MFSLFSKPTVTAAIFGGAVATYCPSTDPINVGPFTNSGSFKESASALMTNCNYCTTGLKSMTLCFQNGFGMVGAVYADFIFKDGTQAKEESPYNTLEGGMISCNTMNFASDEIITSMTSYGISGGQTLQGLKVTTSAGNSQQFGLEYGFPTVINIPSDVVGVAIGKDVKGGFRLVTDTCPGQHETPYVIIGCICGAFVLAIIVYLVWRYTQARQKEIIIEEIRASLRESAIANKKSVAANLRESTLRGSTIERTTVFTAFQDHDQDEI